MSATTTVDGEEKRLTRKIGDYNELGVFLGLQYKWWSGREIGAAPSPGWEEAVFVGIPASFRAPCHAA